MERRNHPRRRTGRTEQDRIDPSRLRRSGDWLSDGNPYAGKSYNTYNAALKRWEQYWADNSGGTIFFYGGLKDGVMDYPSRRKASHPSGRGSKAR